jgi:colanic acid/amylovoran biosynthesis glycosyltransferase
MKILVYTQKFCGNTTTFIYNEVVGLSNNHDVKVVCEERENKEKFPYEDVVETVRSENRLVQALKWRLWLMDMYLGFKDVHFSSGLNCLINTYQPNVIHCHFGYEALRLIDNLDGENKGIPVVITFHGYDASQMLRKKSYVKRLVDFFSKNPNAYALYVTNHFRNRLREAGVPINDSNSLLLYYGIKIDKFCRKSRRKRKPTVFLQASSFASKKGHIYTIEAFRKFIASSPGIDCKLILAGDGPLRPAIESLVNDYGLQDRVEFKGWVSPDEAVNLMEDASVFVHHSVTAENGDQEGIPNAIIEAMAMELPILSTRHSGIPELVGDGENGFLVEERDVHSYAKNMKEILDWGYLPKNREKVASLFELNKHNKKLAEFYKKISSNC